jgi:hypothetical protein
VDISRHSVHCVIRCDGILGKSRELLSIVFNIQIGQDLHFIIPEIQYLEKLSVLA